MIPTDARLLRLYVPASERWRGAPLYRAIVDLARSNDLAGASVYPATLALGSRRRVHDAASDYAAGEIPVVVEIVDAPEPIERLMTLLQPVLGRLVATVEPARVVRYEGHDDRGD